MENGVFREKSKLLKEAVVQTKFQSFCQMACLSLINVEDTK